MKPKMILINGKMVNKDIKELDLRYNNLTQLPVEIGQLTQLTTLDLFNNNLTHLPVEIGQLTQLTELYLDYNQLTHIPVEIGQLTQLTELYLNNNKLTHLPVEIGQLTQLTELDLRYNKLTQLPVEIGQLTQLTILYLNNNKLTHLPVEIGQLTQLTTLDLSGNPIENLLNPIIQRVIQHIQNRANINNGNTIYTDTQNVHSSSIQKSIRDSINNLMNAYVLDYPLTYLDCSVLTQQTKEIITEYLDCNDIHTMLNITFKELFTAVVIEMESLSIDLQIEIQKRLNEEMQESECKCFTGRISRLVNCLSGYSDKVKIQISEGEEISNIISVIMAKRGMKESDELKGEVRVALKERGYADEKIAEWLEYVE